MEAKHNILLKKVDKLKIDLKKKEKGARNSRKKINKATEVVRKIQNYIKNLGNIVNRAKLFYSGLRKVGLVSGGKVITILVDYRLKMETILKEMKVMFTSLDPKAPFQPMPLEVVSNISINNEVLLLLEQ